MKGRSVNAQAAEITGNDELLARWRSGEPAAWREFYEAHWEYAYRTARRLGVPGEELEDVCQEAFAVAFRKAGSFTEGRVTTWLFRIVANLASDRHRRRRLRRALFERWGGKAREEEHAPSPERRLETKDAERVVGAILERMVPKKRECFVLFELEGLSGEEIAERVGCKVDTVWSRIHYARKEFEKVARRMGVLEEVRWER